MSSTPLSSLHHFRFGEKGEKEDKSPQKSPLESRKRHNSEETGVVHHKKKRARVLSSDSDSSPVKTPSSPRSPNPDDQAFERKLNFLSSMFGKIAPSLLREALMTSDQDVDAAAKKLRASSAKKKVPVITHSDSESDEFTQTQVYDSDSDSNESSSRDKSKVLKFFNRGNLQELVGIQGCSKKKAELIIELRPFTDWRDLIRRIKTSKALHTDLLNSAFELLEMKGTMTKLMNRCQSITSKIGDLVSSITEGDDSKMELREQPAILTTKLSLKSYQIIGLNWLALMHKQSLNGILADEMGLGKTVQAIAFLAHLKETGNTQPHLIIVPSSTLDNWDNELLTWCPSLSVLKYHGSQEIRQKLRFQILRENLEFDILLTTYNMVVSSAEDKSLFRKLDFLYVVFDEAHMLKNMSTSRYENLMRVKAPRKLLLTGTPLQNNLVELMSLLVFVMPRLFANKKDLLKKVFSLFPTKSSESSSSKSSRSSYEAERIAHAKEIMKPFFLRRRKAEVIKNLPPKIELLETLPLTTRQKEFYLELLADYQEKARLAAEGKLSSNQINGMSMMMNLRKTANHPLLIRSIFDDKKIHKLAGILKKDPSHSNAEIKLIVEDLSIMSDYEIHKTCLLYKCIESFHLSDESICESGKFEYLDSIFPKLKDNDDRIVMFTQFTMVLDIMEDYLQVRGHKYVRLDGATPVTERQLLIDEFNEDRSIFVFILSTRAGGLGINLTSANTVILHDLDFNPYNDKQAEDRCHRMGQTKPVKIIRLISQDTIEEGIHRVAQDKLRLEQDLTDQVGGGEDHQKVKSDVASLLKTTLSVDMSEKLLEDIKENGEDTSEFYS